MNRKLSARSYQEKIRVTKEFHFEMAHALFNYDGPCRNIHGHSYVLSVTILGTIWSQPEHPKDGLVIDFRDIKRVVNETVIEKFDHALVLNEFTASGLTTELKEHYDKVLIVPFQPSCENLLMEIKDRLLEAFNDSLQLFALKLCETESSWAEWFLSDNNW